MSSYGILVPARGAPPVTVLLRLEGDELTIDRMGNSESVPLHSLRKLSNSPFEIRLGRRKARGWELRASGPIADELRRRVGATGRRIRWGAAKAWHAGLFIGTLLLVELVKLPAEWVAPLIPAALERRLVPDDVRTYGSYCNSPEGERIIRGLIGRFDPEIARSVKIEVLNEGNFLVTSAPGNRLVIYYPFLQSLEGDELAALLAHEVAHLRRKDPLRAALRGNRTLGSLVGTMVGARDRVALLEFSPEEELAADQAAIAMLLRARISTVPGAALFDRMQKEREANRSFGKEQYYMHYGSDPERAKDWRDIPDRSALNGSRPALTTEQADILFNYCWRDVGPRRIPLQQSS